MLHHKSSALTGNDTVRTGQRQVLVVDDSAVVRQALTDIIATDPALAVMATAADPFAAAERLRAGRPDVILLDIEMPRMDGLTFLRKLMAQHPIPVVICSSLVADRSETCLAALAAGAVDVIAKPELGVRGYLEHNAARICEVLRAAAGARVHAQKLLDVAPKLNADAILPAPGARAASRVTEKIVAIGASTGGTEALRVVLQSMPRDCPPIVIVLHMPENFTAAYARRLDGLCDITVSEAKTGDRLQRGRALIAPGNMHTLLTRQGAHYGIEVRDGPLVSRHRPSVDVLFRSAARCAAGNAVGVILTGMGDDGARGLKELRDAGAATLGQDEETCVVYGMPHEAMLAGAVVQELPLSKIPGAILRLAR